MLTISTDTLPQTWLSYLAFRVSFLETLERMALANQLGTDPCESYGFLTEVPFLRSVPPHVQLDLLAATWCKHVSQQKVEASLVDESVVYAACETAARIVENDPEAAERFLKNGPLEAPVPVDRLLAAELRSLHLDLSNEGDFLLISQFEDMHPDEGTELKLQFQLDPQRLEAMFEVLGYWYISENFMLYLDGLLKDREIVRAAEILGGEKDWQTK